MSVFELPETSRQKEDLVSKRADSTLFVHDQFLFVGDSITQSDGDPSLGFSSYQSLQHDYCRRIDVVKRGFSGYNTINALSILPKIFPSPEQSRVRLISFFFGANDISLPNTTGQHVPLRDFKENIRRLVSHPKVQAHVEISILLITPPPIDEWSFDHWDEPGRSARTAVTAQQYAEGVKEIGKEMGVAVVNLWGACMKEAMERWDASIPTERGVEPLMPGDKRAAKSAVLARLLYDGLHLSGDGYKILYQGIKNTIIEAYPQLCPSSIPVALEPFFP